MDNDRQDKLTISLLENGLHSLQRGIRAFETHSSSPDPMLLKDAIMSLHHGVELLLKQILITTSPFLIFEDLRDASRKQQRADDLGLAIFFIENPPKTVAYDEAISRVRAFIKPPELSAELIADLQHLNRLRNQLEHYALEADLDEITQLIARLQQPLLTLLEAHIPNLPSRPMPLRDEWERAHLPLRRLAQAEEEVFSVVSRIHGQEVPGELVNLSGSFTFPPFNSVRREVAITSDQGTRFIVDILAEAPGELWIIEIKSMARKSYRSALLQLLAYKSLVPSTLWLVTFSQVDAHFKEEARSHGILLTSELEWPRLKQAIGESA